MDDDRKWNLFLELYDHMPRGGPGNRACARRALDFMPDLPSEARVAEVGSGPGEQVFELAELLPQAHIVAVDILEHLVLRIRARAAAAGLAGRIEARTGDMRNLQFAAGSLDLLWSEGAIYNMGFREGIRSWNPFLKPGGYLAVSEAVWLTPHPPEPARKMWEAEYPAIADIPANIAMLREEGYHVAGHFTLPRAAWWEGYYVPLQASLEKLQAKYAGDSLAAEVLEQTRQEIETYRLYGDSYSYEFFVARKP